MIIATANRLNTVKEYYFSTKLKEIRQLIQAGKPIINLGIGSPDLPPSTETISALQSCAQQSAAHGYQSYTGTPELRKAISHWYKQTYQVGLNYEQEVLPLMGSKEGIMHLSMAFLNPGDGVLVPNPGYLTYTSVAKLLNANIISYDLQESGWLPNFKAIEKQNDLSKVKIMWVNYPNMPTGANATTALFQQLVAFGKKHQILIVNDNPYSLVLNPKPQSILQTAGAKEVCLELNSLSKSHNMAGWRVGMLCGAADYIKAVLKVKSNMDSGMFLGIQKAAVKALQNSPTWHAQQNQQYAQRKQIATQILSTLGCTYQTQQVGMFIWAKIPNTVTDVIQWTDEVLYKTNVFITPGLIFGSAGKHYVRISLCSKLDTFQQALKRVQAAYATTTLV